MYSGFKNMTTTFANDRGQYPMNQAVQVRVTGLDNSSTNPAALGSLSPVHNHPEYDVAVSFGLHCYAG